MSYPVHHDHKLYRWKRFSRPEASKTLKTSKKNDVEKWLEKVEAATENAVRKTFNADIEHGRGQLDFGVSDWSSESRDHIIANDLRDDPLQEAQELVSEWVNEKLRYDFIAPEKGFSLDVDLEENEKHPSLTSGIETAAHEKWYEDSETFIQQYLDSELGTNIRRRETHKNRAKENDVLGQLDIYEADEETVISTLMKKMMEKPVISPSDLRTLKKKSTNERKVKPAKFRDPKMTMDMRHKEVKEARMKRQKEEERKRQEMLLKKEARFKAQQILQEEEAQKKLMEKREEAAIQAEMAKLRKEMADQRKREEKERREREKVSEKAAMQKAVERTVKREEMEKRERDRQKEKILTEISRLEKKEQKVAEVMKKRNTNNRRLVQSCFSTWCKLVLTSRVKMGKAKAMSDWKLMQRTWAAWKCYSQSQKLDLETRNHEAKVKETRLKEKRAIECAKLRSLRKCFFMWKVWVRTEQERKEILKQQQNTKAKMQALLDAVTSGSVAKENALKDLPTVLQSVDSQDDVQVLPHFKPQKARRAVTNPNGGEKSPSIVSKPGMPREAWKITKKDVRRLKPDEITNVVDSGVTSQRSQKSSRTYDPFQNRHNFQKEVIEQQRILLKEQKRMIKKMQEQQSLQELQKEIAVLKEQRRILESNTTTPQNQEQTYEAKITQGNLENPSSARTTSSNTSNAKQHPIVSKMEERALERARRKKELEEMKRKREEEKLKKIQEEEELKKREEEERKKKELQERREAKRMQKKVEEEKKAAQEKLRLLYKAAGNHHTMSLLKYRGFRPWRKLIDAARKKHEVASYHYENCILKKAMIEWRAETERITQERLDKADSLQRVLLLRRGMRCWKKYGERMEILEEKAVLHWEKVQKKRYLKYWVDYTTDEKLSEWRKESQADDHNRVRMLRRVFNVLRSYRELVKREIERRQRLEEMRRKVTKLLPDFQYTKESFNSDIVDTENEE